MSEFEIGILRQRAQEAYRQKVQRGEVMTMVPIGYERSGTVGIEMAPDRQIQQAIRGLFSRLDAMGTLRQVLLWYLPRRGGTEEDVYNDLLRRHSQRTQAFRRHARTQRRMRSREVTE